MREKYWYYAKKIMRFYPFSKPAHNFPTGAAILDLQQILVSKTVFSGKSSQQTPSID